MCKVRNHLTDRKEKILFGSIKLLAERGTKVRLLTTSSIKKEHFNESTDNLTIKNIEQHQLKSPRPPKPQLDLLILVDEKEMHVDKLGENMYSDDPKYISDILSDFDRLWDIGSSLSRYKIIEWNSILRGLKNDLIVDIQRYIQPYKYSFHF